MNPKARDSSAPHSAAPFGAQVRRPRWPLWLLALLYGVWLLVLIWLAMAHTGR